MLQLEERTIWSQNLRKLVLNKFCYKLKFLIFIVRRFFANLVLGETKKNFACRYLLTYGTKRPKTKEQ